MSISRFIHSPQRGYSGPGSPPNSAEESLHAPASARDSRTTLFDGAQAMKGYALNKMCYSFNSAANREDFKRDEDAYCMRYGLNAEQREAIRRRNVLALIAAGGNVYYLAKFAGVMGLDVQDLGAQQTGMSKDAFKSRLVAAGR
ncbi:MAG: protocatechuate 4,5-dioxygenase subunit alpha [Gammaproteobacteria bacterium]|nr:protocatechuate 4,5-dioxygenase subunit alpha [Gammaproteobacteria bacterium]